MDYKEVIFGETLYKVNNRGEVFNVKRNMAKLKGQLQRSINGYIFYRLGYKVKYAHRLVYETFVGKIPKGMEIMHRNGDRFDNRLDNLDCGTQKQNSTSYSKHLAQGSHDAVRRTHKEIKEFYQSGIFSKEAMSITYGYPTDVIVAISRSEF